MAKPAHISLGPLGVQSLKRRFWTKVRIGAPTDCWPWAAMQNKAGYGLFRLGSVKVLAHRVAYALSWQDPGDLIVCHRCDNPVCVNPSHLFIGTTADNAMDKAAKGRGRTRDQRGDRNARAAISAEAIPEIVDAFKRGENNTLIGKRHGVSHATISLIRLGRTWKAETEAAGWRPAKMNRRRAQLPPALAEITRLSEMS